LLEEGINAVQLRKEVRYHELVVNINENNWNAELITLEIGARGLIGINVFRAFVKLGLPPQTATILCRTLSVVVARCSYAICLAHDSKEWPHMDLVLAASGPQPSTAHLLHQSEESKETRKEDEEAGKKHEKTKKR